MERSECFSEDQLESYLRREHSEAEIPGFEEHLVVCRACRLNLLGRQHDPIHAVDGFRLPDKVKREVGRMPNKSSFLGRWPQAPAFAIAALLLIVITAGGLWRFTHKTETQNANGDVLRAAGKRQTHLRVVSPAENAVVAAPTLELKWTPEADAIRYTVVLLDESGDIAHQAETTLNHLLIDTEQAQLQAEKKYFWRVRAKLTDGTESATTPAAFYISRK